MSALALAQPAPARAAPGARPGLVMAGAVGLLALPSAVLAFSTRIDLSAEGISANQGMGAFAPGRADPRLARALAARQAAQGRDSLFRFTPAGLAARPDRSVTVAVRVDSEAARTIVVSGVAPRAPMRIAPQLATVRIAPTAYNLGLSRGFLNFSPGTSTLGLPTIESHRQGLPDIAAIPRADGDADSRLAPHIALGDRERVGSAPRTLEGSGESSVDLGGAYHVTRNLDLTAGVRYSRDRDRLNRGGDSKSDSQAVFVGTQFRF